MRERKQTVKDALNKMKATSNDVVIIRDNGKESRCPFCGPYKKLIENKFDSEVKDYWREGYTIIIVLKTNGNKNDKEK